MSSGKIITIGLLWHSVRSGNLGIGALTVSNIELLRAACAETGVTPQFVVMGSREASPSYLDSEDVKASDIDTRFVLSPSGYWASLRSVDCIVDIGGGDSFTDIYGMKRFLFLWTTKWLATLRGLPLLLSPQTIGPFTRPLPRAMASYILKRADVVVARDPLSYEAAGALMGKECLRQSIDVAFALPYTPRKRRDGGQVEVGLNVSGLLFNGGYSGTNSFGLEVDYTELTRSLIRDLGQVQGVKIKLITHVVSNTMASDDDRVVADLLAREFPFVERVPDFASPSAAKSYISGLDLLIGARMHACIAAYSSGVAVVPIAYSRKFTGLFEAALGYSHGVPVKGWSTAKALEYLLGCVERRETLRIDVERGLEAVEERLDVYRATLRSFLAPMAGQRQ